MKTAVRNAFSLIEVVIAIGLAAFALVAIIGGYTVGLEAAAASQHQTRSSHLAKSIFAVLHAAPFNQVACFGTTLDLTSLGAASAPVKLYAAFPVNDRPEIGDAPLGGDGGYTMELRFQAIRRAEDGALLGSQVALSIAAVSQPARSYRYVSVVGNY